MALLAASACTDDALVSPSRPGVVDENGMVTLAFSTNIPELKLTKSVDINGERINTLWLVAFNEEGYMVSRVLAEQTNNVQGTAGGTGTFTAQVPSSTRRLHFLANVNMDNFSDQDNIGRHENEVIAPLVSSSGNLVYWGRKTFTDIPNLADHTIILYRNQALVDYNIIQNTGLEVTGWAICNQYAYGTVAPFNSSATELENGNGFLFDLNQYDFVTTLPEAYNIKQSDDQDVGEASQSQEEGTEDPRYLFETPNPEDDQVYVIMKIKKDGTELYYKIMLVNEDKEPYPIIRNHKYLIEIRDVNTAYGVGSFEEAKNATPANNPWITVDDVVPEVSSGNITLRIEGETTVLYQEDKPGEITIDFYYNGTEQPTVSWIDNEGVTASNEIAPKDIVWDSQTGKGTITLHVNRPAQQGLTRGTLQVKAGALSRRVQVITSQLFEFSPVWVSSEIPLLDGEAITVLFHIPDDFPQELLPVEVKFGCDLIDARADQPLAVVMEENVYNVDWWNYTTQSWQSVEVKKDWNYKYVYTAKNTGEHRVNFRTILTDLSSGGVNHQEEFHIYMEGDDPQTGNDLFRQRDLYFAFQPGSNAHRILLDNGDANNNYATRTISQLDPVTGETIEIPFTLGTLGNNNSFNPATLNGSTTLWVYYDKEVLEPTWTDATATDPYGNHYAAYTATQAKNTLTFESISPVFDSYVALTARSADGYPTDMGFTGAYALEGNDRANAFRSASVTLRTTGRMNFTVALSATGSNYTTLADGETYSLPYGEGQDLYLQIGIPQEAQGKNFSFNVETEHFEPTEEGWTHDGTMWTYPLQNAAATQTFRFRANRLASGETLRFSTDNSVGFNDVEVTLANTPLSGTIQLPEGQTFHIENPYVILERVSDGTRIGTFNLLDNPNEQSEVNYELTLRSEYNLNATDRVTVRWMRVTDNVEFTSNGLLLQDIMGEGITIPLVKKE